MKELIPITVFCCILAILAQKNSQYSVTSGTCIYKNSFFYICIAVALIVFAGLRTYYNDTQTYKEIYRQLEINASFWTNFDWQLGENPGFHLLNALLKILGFSVQSYLLTYAAITISIYIWFLRKYSDSPALTIFLFFTLGCLDFVIAAVKQGLAIALCLVATDSFIKKKWGWFVFWVLAASTFHPYALMYLLIPFLTFCPWTIRTYIFIGLFALAGFLLNSLLGTLVSITTMIGEEYDISLFSGSGVNPFRLVVIAAPTVISFIAQRQIQFHNNKVENLFTNMTTLNAEIMFVALFGNPIYFGRLANYFLIFQTISLPYLLQYFEKKSRRFIVIVAVVCYSFFFWYENHLTFDVEFDRITIFQYLKSLLN